MAKFLLFLRTNKVVVAGLVTAVLTVAGANTDVVGAVANLVAISF